MRFSLLWTLYIIIQRIGHPLKQASVGRGGKMLQHLLSFWLKEEWVDNEEGANEAGPRVCSGPKGLVNPLSKMVRTHLNLPLPGSGFLKIPPWGACELP